MAGPLREGTPPGCADVVNRGQRCADFRRSVDDAEATVDAIVRARYAPFVTSSGAGVLDARKVVEPTRRRVRLETVIPPLDTGVLGVRLVAGRTPRTRTVDAVYELVPLGPSTGGVRVETGPTTVDFSAPVWRVWKQAPTNERRTSFLLGEL